MSRLSRFINWLSEEIHEARHVDIDTGPRICLLHVMKTAGTSLRLMLQEDLGRKAVFPNSKDLCKRPHGWYPLADEVVARFSSLRAHRLLVGHFPAAILSALPKRYLGAVFLRDPIQRSLSVLTHYAEILRSSPDELVRDTGFMATKILDYQTKILGGECIDDPNQHDRVDDRTLDRALRRIEDLAFVGITERFAESCNVFDVRFGTTIARRLQHKNVRRPHGREYNHLISVVKPFVQRDCALYDRAMARFEYEFTRCCAASGDVPHGTGAVADRRIARPSAISNGERDLMLSIA